MAGTILEWNIPNWITVILMVILVYMAAAMITQAIKAKSSGGDDSNPQLRNF